MKLEELVNEAAAIEGKSEWTLTEAIRNPKIAWEIITLISKDENFIVTLVGRDKKDKPRTDVATIKQMAAMYKKVIKFAETDNDDGYKAFYTELADTFNTYAAKVLLDMYKVDDTIIQQASEIKAAKKKATAERLEKARAARGTSEEE